MQVITTKQIEAVSGGAIDVRNAAEVRLAAASNIDKALDEVIAAAAEAMSQLAYADSSLSGIAQF